MNQTSGLGYSCTNENLKGVVLGLALSSEDYVLAVAGSGDQAFAFLEFARQVKAVDIVPEQIELMRKRAEALRIGDYDKFLRVEGTGYADGWIYQEYNDELRKIDELKRRSYFVRDDSKRLERIRANLDNLIIAKPANILEIAQTESGFSKIYLSNVLGFGNDRSDVRATQILEKIARNLPINGLIYVANHDILSDTKSMLFLYMEEDNKRSFKDLYSILDKDKDLLEDSFLPPELELELDMELSRKARSYEGIWKPAVYRKVEPKTPSTF